MAMIGNLKEDSEKVLNTVGAIAKEINAKSVKVTFWHEIDYFEGEFFNSAEEFMNSELIRERAVDIEMIEVVGENTFNSILFHTNGFDVCVRVSDVGNDKYNEYVSVVSKYAK